MPITYSSRAPILPLPQDVAERIAAGEVIERPVSVVKELVENALDAGATEVRVEIRGGGMRLIRVTDDGCGIPEDELERASARHNTSKINRLEDLEHLHTLGFRGEALASIAAVSELTLLSRAIETETMGEEHPALFITWRGGEVTQRGRKARLHGTTVTVRDLFYNVPARLKFMRGARTEAGHIERLLRRYAVGYPGVRFHLTIEEHAALQTGGSGNLATTLAELYHLPLAEMLNPIAVNTDEDSAHAFALHGYIGNRALAQNNRQHVTLFVNGRWVQSRPLQEALEAGYRGLLPKGKHPLLVLHVDLPTEDVDVNVHPAKTEVKLLHEAEVIEAMTKAIRGVLERSPALPEEAQFPGPQLVYQRRLPGVRRRGLHVSESAEHYSVEKPDPGAAEVLATLRPLAQLQQAVILAEAPDGSLYLIDQHRAHERVIYEHLRRTYTGVGAQENQGEEWTGSHLLLEPVIVELKRHEAELFEMRLPLLRGLGLECERFGGRSFLIRSVPGGVGQEQLAGHLPELARIAAEDSDEWENRLLIGLACRSALRRGRTLGLDEQRSLINALANATAPAVCPHGSPILLHYSRTFLIDKFDW
ncbi:MAG TPA: DNA mismatch repair endonuclease MutL [Ktedonobacteraceae bacterium]|jgi:DNA mismatch repair protein MutL|nr:DNA mismatch repair endonuclease MutL [Ktedonobacteraceae bacterium]